MGPQKLRLNNPYSLRQRNNGVAPPARSGDQRSEHAAISLFCSRARAAGRGLHYVALALLLLTCKPTDTGRLNPQAPKPAYNQTAMDVRNEKYLSTINVPVSISMKDVERQLNAQVNGLLYEDNDPSDNNNDKLLLKVWKRAPLTVSVSPDSLFLFRVPLRIWAKAGVGALGFVRWQETEFELDMRFRSKFSLDPDWSVTTQTQADGYDWVRRPTTRVAGFDVPITNIIDRALTKNLGSITQALDKQVHRQVDLRTPVLNAWNTLRQPYLLSDKYRTYLLVVPRRVLITPFRIAGNTIHSTIGLEGYAITATGAKPDVRPAVTLPNLAVVDQVNDDFQVGLLGEISYQEAARLAAEEFVGKSYSFREGRYNITLTSIDMYGQNDNLIIQAGLSGSVAGTVYLRGRPVYDPTTQTIGLKDLRYDLDTRNLLQRTAGWLLQGTFARMLEKQFTIPVGSQLAEVQQAIQARLRSNRVTQGVVLNGTLDEVRPDQVYLTPNAMLAVIFARGRVNVTVDGL